jgi:hypothetical protein
MKKRNLIFLASLIVALLAFGYFAKPDIPTITNGVFTSIIASFLFFIFTMLVDNSSDEIKNGLMKVDNKISTIREHIDTDPTSLKNRFGIIKIEHRKEYSYDFWATLLNDALITKTSKFIISGKTLHRWLEPKIAENFRKTLLELISRKAQIIFVIYSNPSNGQKKKALQDFLSDKIYPHLVKTCGNDLKKINKVFSIYEVDSLPYLYTAIDSQVVVAQYFNNTSNAENIMLVLDPKCPFACRYQNDFDCIIKDNISNTWIQDFLQKKEENQK